jgi:hypothetical protein
MNSNVKMTHFKLPTGAEISVADAELGQEAAKEHEYTCFKCNLPAFKAPGEAQGQHGRHFSREAAKKHNCPTVD